MILYNKNRDPTMSAPGFSHTLAISLIDIEGDTTMADDILEEIKTRITEKPRIYTIAYKGIPFDAILYWKRQEVLTDNTNANYMNTLGDLATVSPYIDGEIIYEHTKQMLYEIDNECKMKYSNTQWCLIFDV